MEIKITFDEIRKYLEIDLLEIPKYVSSIINLANQYAQGTRPKVVGKVSELIKEFTGKSLSDWENWYLQQNPEAIKIATQKILQKIKEFKNTLNKIDEPTIERWVKDLVIIKTFIGFRFQEAILKKLSEIEKTNYRIATFEEESKGIDGYIGDTPVSIKPISYKSKPMLKETINAKIIFYKKVKDGIIFTL